MNERLLQFLKAENISQAQFADRIGVARASISHILAGRNKPGYDFIESVMKNFPALNIEWLLAGNGKMYKFSAIGNETSDDLFSSLYQNSQLVQQEAEQETEQNTSHHQLSTVNDTQVDTTPDQIQDIKASTKNNTLVKTTESIEHKRTITKILVFYSDNTYQEIS